MISENSPIILQTYHNYTNFFILTYKSEIRIKKYKITIKGADIIGLDYDKWYFIEYSDNNTTNNDINNTADNNNTTGNKHTIDINSTTDNNNTTNNDTNNTNNINKPILNRNGVYSIDYNYKSNLQSQYNNFTQEKIERKKIDKKIKAVKFIEATPEQLCEYYLKKQPSKISYITPIDISYMNLFYNNYNKSNNNILYSKVLVEENIKGIFMYSILYRNNINITVTEKKNYRLLDRYKDLIKYLENSNSNENLEGNNDNDDIDNNIEDRNNNSDEYNNGDNIHNNNITTNNNNITDNNDITRTNKNNQETYDIFYIVNSKDTIKSLKEYKYKRVIIYLILREEASKIYNYLLENNYKGVYMVDLMSREYQYKYGVHPLMNNRLRYGYILSGLKVE